MIELSNGHKFLFMAASGALGYNGKDWPWKRPLRWIGLTRPDLFTIVTKTVTREPKKGNNPLRAIRFIDGGVVNALGMGNPGIEKLIRKIKNTKLNLIISIAGTPLELLEMTRMLNDLKNIKGIELNFSCPNIDEDITSPEFLEAIIRTCNLLGMESVHHPLILKISPAQDYITIAKTIEDMGIEAISINSAPWILYSDEKSPLQKFGGGGVSGKAAQLITWKVVRELSQATSIPVIGPSVWEYENINELLKLGAKAISFGSIFLKHPLRPTRFVRKYYQQ